METNFNVKSWGLVYYTEYIQSFETKCFIWFLTALEYRLMLEKIVFYTSTAYVNSL